MLSTADPQDIAKMPHRVPHMCGPFRYALEHALRESALVKLCLDKPYLFGMLEAVPRAIGNLASLL